MVISLEIAQTSGPWENKNDLLMQSHVLYPNGNLLNMIPEK